jgi:hypothetical protein
MVTVLDNVLGLLAEFGFFRVVLPFLLVFGIFYAVLLKTGILGSKEDDWTKGISAIIAFVAAFLVISYTPVVDALITLIPQASFLLVVVMLLLLLLAFIGVPVQKWTKETRWYAWIFIIPLVIIFLGLVDYATGFQIPGIHSLTTWFIGSQGVGAASSETMSTLLGLGIVLGIPLLIVALIVWGGPSKSKKKKIGEITAPEEG